VNATTWNWIGVGIVITGLVVNQVATYAARTDEEGRTKAALAHELLINYSRMEQFWIWADRNVPRTESGAVAVGEETYRKFDAAIPARADDILNKSISLYIKALTSEEIAALRGTYATLDLLYQKYSQANNASDAMRRVVWAETMALHSELNNSMPLTAQRLWPDARQWLATSCRGAR